MTNQVTDGRDRSIRLLVQKYGGSSVGNAEKIQKVAQKIARTVHSGGTLQTRVVVVVSAMGDTTDELLGLAEKVSANLYHPQYKREMDMLLSSGERIATALLSMALRDVGVEAISFTGSQAGIITDESHTRARILEIKPFRVLEELNRGKVVLVAGFQGVSRAKEITTLGRGGSDTTAVALARALKADCCEIYTDVPGIFSADPRVVPGARRYETLPLDLVFEMSVKGAQVMHPRSIEIARQGGFPLYVGLAHGIGDGQKEGTMLVPDQSLELPQVVSVTSKKGLEYLRFPNNTDRILSELAEESIVVHEMSIREGDGLTLLLDPNEAAGFLARHQKNVVKKSVSAVSVIGYQMQQNTEIPSKMMAVLGQLKIEPVCLTCQSQSITVCFSESEKLAETVKKLHELLHQ